MGNVVPDVLDQFMPTEAPVYRLTDVPLVQWDVQGLVIDWEDTVGVAGDAEGVPKHIDHIRQHLGERAIRFLAIATNKTPKNDDDRRMLEGWREQVGADIILHPMDGSERKPSATMLRKAVEADVLGLHNIPRDGALWGMIGDKATSDVRAGNFAQFEHIAWTRPFSGSERHLGDRILRDPFEHVLRVLAHLELNPVLQVIDKDKKSQLVAPDGSMLSLDPAVFENFIVGDGIADIKLSAESLALIQTPKYREFINGMKELYDEKGEIPREKLREFLYENGRTVADGLVWGRLGAAVAIAALHYVDMDDKSRLQLQTAIAAFGNLADILDGKAARADKDGATEQGGLNDQRIDKILSASEDIFMLLPAGMISKTDVFVPLLRDSALTLLRRPFNARGIDTKSVSSGKNAMLLLGGSQLVSGLLGERYPVFARRLRLAANAGKVVSALHAPIVWVEQHEIAQHEHNLAAAA